MSNNLASFESPEMNKLTVSRITSVLRGMSAPAGSLDRILAARASNYSELRSKKIYDPRISTEFPVTNASSAGIFTPDNVITSDPMNSNLQSVDFPEWMKSPELEVIHMLNLLEGGPTSNQKQCLIPIHHDRYHRFKMQMFPIADLLAEEKQLWANNTDAQIISKCFHMHRSEVLYMPHETNPDHYKGRTSIFQADPGFICQIKEASTGNRVMDTSLASCNHLLLPLTNTEQDAKVSKVCIFRLIYVQAIAVNHFFRGYSLQPGIPEGEFITEGNHLDNIVYPSDCYVGAYLPSEQWIDNYNYTLNNHTRTSGVRNLKHGSLIFLDAPKVGYKNSREANARTFLVPSELPIHAYPRSKGVRGNSVSGAKLFTTRT